MSVVDLNMTSLQQLHMKLEKEADLKKLFDFLTDKENQLVLKDMIEESQC